MKSLLFISMAFTFVLPINSVSAQDSKMSLGIQVKPTITWLSGIYPNFERRTSYSTGLIFDYQINSKFTLKSGISFERKGGKFSKTFIDTTGIPSGPFDVCYNSDYLIVPIVVSFSTKVNGKIKAYFDAGSYIGYSLNQSIYQEAFGPFPEITTRYTDRIKRFDLGVSIGSGLCFPLGSSFVFDIGLNGNFGLINTRKAVVNRQPPLKPNSVGLLMAIKYRL